MDAADKRFLADFILEGMLMHLAGCEGDHCAVTDQLKGAADQVGIDFRVVGAEAAKVEDAIGKAHGKSLVLEDYRRAKRHTGLGLVRGSGQGSVVSEERPESQISDLRFENAGPQAGPPEGGTTNGQGEGRAGSVRPQERGRPPEAGEGIL